MQKLPRKKQTYASKNWSIKSTTKLLFSGVQRTPSQDSNTHTHTRNGRHVKAGEKMLGGACTTLTMVDKKHSQGNKNDNSYKVAAGDTYYKGKQTDSQRDTHTYTHAQIKPI